MTEGGSAPRALCGNDVERGLARSHDLTRSPTNSWVFPLPPQIAVAIPIVVGAIGLAGLRSTAPFGAMEQAGVALFLLGSCLETGSELQRKAFKADPANKGKLYYGGLFALAQHINYTGEVLWYTGLALMAHAPLLAAVFFFGFSAFFAAVGVPELQTHLKARP